jgi:hypothetical protein
MGAHELSTLLWRERELLELLMFKLEEEQLLLTAGKTKWLPFATREVEQVLERLRTAGLERAVEVSTLSREWGTDDGATLRDIIAHAPNDSWREIFQTHLQSLTALTATIAELRDANMQYLRSATRSVQETLASLSPEQGTYDGHGVREHARAGAHFFDRDL